jgi:sortase A
MKFKKLFIIIPLAILSLLLIFHKPLTHWFLEYNSHKTHQGSGLKPEYDSSKAQSISPLQAVKLQFDASKLRAEGQIAIPDVGINLSIFEGLNNEHLLSGAGEQLPRTKMKMGQEGNYILASHLSEDPKLLFSPLRQLKDGTDIYITDGKQIYVYQSDWRKTVNKANTTALNEEVPAGEKWLTLYTCLNYGTTYRVVVRAHLINQIDVKLASNRDLQPFFNKSNEMTGYLKWYYLHHY